MIHLLISFFFLLLVGLLLFGYTCLFLFLLRYSFHVVFGIRHDGLKWYIFVPVWKDCGISLKGVKIIGLICLVVTVGLYFYERSRWITPRSSHLNAKQYLIVDMVLMDYRTIGNSFIYPERMIWKPAVWLQRWITHNGLSLIPENDGERAIWKYHFVLAPYINRIHNPRNEESYSLISTCEYILETLATRKIADQDLNNRNKYIIYPLVTFYYQWIYKARYSLTPSPYCYYKGLYRDPQQYQYLKQVVDWSIKMENEWPQHPAVVQYMQENPEIALIHLASVGLTLHEIINYQIHHLEFTCDDRYVNLYYEYLARYRAKNSPYYRVDRQLRKRLDHALILHGGVINFFGHRLCNFPILPGYNIRTVKSLGGEGPGWYEAFLELNKRLVPKDRQQEVLDRFEQFGGEVLQKKRTAKGEK